MIDIIIDGFEAIHPVYKKGENYTKYLTYIKMYGNSNNRVIEMKDEENNILIWTTTDYSKTYRNFRLKAYYSFKVSFISNENKIYISYLNLKKDKKIQQLK